MLVFSRKRRDLCCWQTASFSSEEDRLFFRERVETCAVGNSPFFRVRRIALFFEKEKLTRFVTRKFTGEVESHCHAWEKHHALDL